jgi:hypothetical protein
VSSGTTGSTTTAKQQQPRDNSNNNNNNNNSDSQQWAEGHERNKRIDQQEQQQMPPQGMPPQGMQDPMGAFMPEPGEPGLAMENNAMMNSMAQFGSELGDFLVQAGQGKELRNYQNAGEKGPVDLQVQGEDVFTNTSGSTNTATEAVTTTETIDVTAKQTESVKDGKGNPYADGSDNATDDEVADWYVVRYKIWCQSEV